MKLIVITASIHFEKDIKEIFKKAQIDVFSQTDVSGHNESKDDNMRNNWFAMSDGYQKSIIFFSFTENEKAEQALQFVNQFNDSIASKSRIKAFIMPVEKHN